MRTLKDFFSETGTQQTAFAARCGVSWNYMSEIARGLKQPSMKIALVIERETGGAVPLGSWPAFRPIAHRIAPLPVPDARVSCPPEEEQTVSVSATVENHTN